ncbi:MAG: choice-of-anchor D domain-containing protein [Opitutaceae bacterium]|nr:choice-of-anchor D domain-containing protein [Opitutaceae bacterium]
MTISRPLLAPGLGRACFLPVWLSVCLALLLGLAAPVAQAAPNTHYVWNNSDLIGAINDANNRNDGTSIIFRQSFTITNYIPGITGSMIIDGAGFTLDANRNQFYCGDGRAINVTIRNLTITNAGDIGGDGGNGGDSHLLSVAVEPGNGGGGGAGMGGAVRVSTAANVVLENVTITRALAQGGKGGAGGTESTLTLGIEEGGNGGGRTGGAKGAVGANGSNGGFGGGGGGGGGGSTPYGVYISPVGGRGGYGGGGGGSRFWEIPFAPDDQGGARGGWGGGSGGTFQGDGRGNAWGGSGGGGAGLGGAIFVQEGGVLTLAGGLSIRENSAVGGLTTWNAIMARGTDGIGAGNGVFMQGNGILTFDSAADQVVNDTIADEAGTRSGGSWAIFKQGAGSLTLAGAHTYTGDTVVLGGRLVLAGSLNSAISNFATFAPRGNVSTSRTYSQNSTGTLQVRLGAGMVDRINAASATLAGALEISTEAVPAPGTYVPIVASGALTGTFAGLPNGSEFSVGPDRIRINYTANAVILTVFAREPRIAVAQPLGNAIPPGGVTDIGGAFPATTASKTIYVTNVGVQALSFLSLGSSSPEFTFNQLAGVFNGQVQPGGVATFVVTFAPAGPGVRSGTISIGTDDPTRPLFTFTVRGSVLAPTFNAAATAGLPIAVGSGPVDLAALTGASPAGGVFSGPGVSGGLFNPTAAGPGVHVITYTALGASTTFQVNNGGSLVLEENGGDFAPGNLAPAGVAFAKDTLPGYAAHAVAHLNDGLHGNAHSWINNSADSFAGVSLGVTPVAINRIAFGRDNTGEFTDRAADLYTLQYTTVPNPNDATAYWVTLGQVDLRSGTALANPSRRQVFSFPTVAATGVRILTAANGTAIDEIEVYPAEGVAISGPFTLRQEGGNLAPGNLVRAPGASVFGKDEFGGIHQIAKVGDGLYGNASSWIGASGFSFVGVAFGQSTTFSQIAFGRDNTGVYADRAVGRYIVQITSVANPGPATPVSEWTMLGTIRYENIAAPGFAKPALRHRFSFPPVTATGLRVIAVENGLAIDELEVFATGQPRLSVSDQGTPLATGEGWAINLPPPSAGTTVQRTLTITNTGSDPLNLGTPTLAGLDAGSFTLTAVPPAVLAPGASAPLTVTVALGGLGSTRVATLSLPNDAPDQPGREILVSATVQPNAAPRFDVPATLTVERVSLLTMPGFASNITVGAAWESAQSLRFRVTTDRPGLFSTQPALSPDGTLTLACSGLSGISSATVTVVAQDDGGVAAGGSDTSAPRIFVVTFAPRPHDGVELLESGGTSSPGNLARESTFVIQNNSDVSIVPPSASFLNDGIYGESGGWKFPSSLISVYVILPRPTLIDRLAISSDNTGANGERVTSDLLGIFYSADPGAMETGVSTPLAYLELQDPLFGPESQKRKLLRFPPVVASVLFFDYQPNEFPNMMIDEIEVYAAPVGRDRWRMESFGTVAPSGPAADGADPDGDGLPNLVEYALDLNPIAAARAGARLAVDRSGDHLEMRFLRARDDVVYEVQASNDLVEWTTIARNPGAVGATVVVTDTEPASAQSRRFLRLKVSP